MSEDRNCADAGIDNYWCSCLKRTKVENSPYLASLAKRFVDFINDDILKDQLELCHKLELDSVNSVYLTNSYVDTTELRKFDYKNNTQIKKLKMAEPPKIQKDFKKYLFVITTKPNGGEYEFTLTIQNNVDNTDQTEPIEINKLQISRINKYGNDEHCIHDKFPDLRKYCFCKK